MKQKSLANKVLLLILFNITVVAMLITFVGAKLIYDVTKSGISNEIVGAAETLRNLFQKEHPGDLNSSAYFIYRYGEKIVIAEDFYNIVDYIGCSDDVEFTVFYGDIRIFTTIVNPSGSTPVGTKAMDFVAEDVINGGKTMVYDNIDINGEIYMGCYVPIINSDGAVAGMYFAGRPLRTAIDNVRMVIIGFISVVAVTLIISVTLCIVFTEKMIKDLGDIKQYINKIATGDFDARMQEKTLKRDDEIGDIGRNAEKLYVNLRDMVERDPLTMLLNRRSCLMKMTEFTENKILYTVAMGDIDFFKKINDTYGHACGDYVLKEVSALLKRHTGDNEAFASRWGGEEFLIVLPSKGTEESLRIVTEILEEIRKTNYEYEGKTFKVTMTFGISQFRNGDNRESAVNRADKLLYKGKQSGRNRIVV